MGPQISQARPSVPRNVTHRRYTQSLQRRTIGGMGRRRTSDIHERFGFAVKARREELGVTQEDLAARAGIHRTYLSDVERGSRNLSLLNVEKLAAALAICLPDLFKRVEALR